MKHFGIFSNSGDVQTALDEQTLLNPYVAKVSGALDYNTIEPRPEFYIEDSDGNIYRPTGKTEGIGEISYGFDFQADVDATWTLYCDGNVVTASSCNIIWYHECNGNAHDVEQISTPGMVIANIAPTSPISYDEPIQHLDSTVVYYGDTCTFDANIKIPYCGEDPSSSGSAS